MQPRSSQTTATNTNTQPETPAQEPAAHIGNTLQQTTVFIPQIVPMSEEFSYLWTPISITPPETEDAMVIETKDSTSESRVIDFDKHVITHMENNVTKKILFWAEYLTLDEAQMMAAYIKSNPEITGLHIQIEQSYSDEHLEIILKDTCLKEFFMGNKSDDAETINLTKIASLIEKNKNLKQEQKKSVSSSSSSITAILSDQKHIETKVAMDVDTTVIKDSSFKDTSSFSALNSAGTGTLFSGSTLTNPTKNEKKEEKASNSTSISKRKRKIEKASSSSSPLAELSGRVKMNLQDATLFRIDNQSLEAVEYVVKSVCPSYKINKTTKSMGKNSR